MRILWVKTELLHPLDKGGRIRTYQMLRCLSREHHVVYLCLDDGQAAPDAVALAKEYASEVVTVPFRSPARFSVGFFLDAVRNLASPLPYAAAKYRSPLQRAAVARLAGEADLVVCDFLFPAQNVPSGLTARTVLFQHNVEAVIWERHASVPQNPIRRAYMRLQWRRMQKTEAAECRRFDHVVAVSDGDARKMALDYGVSSVSAVGTGVDTEFFARTSMRPPNSHELVFVGSMDWMPNDDGIGWFLEEVYPLVRAAVPDVTLTIVGRHPSAALRRRAAQRDGVEVTGSVPDVRPYLERAAVSVVPIRIGGGTRIKIFEAMAASVPVVSTTIGAEGLQVMHGQHLLVADSPEAQAEAIVGLLLDTGRAMRLAEDALDYVRRFCSWEAIVGQFMKQCATIPSAGPLCNAERAE